MVVKGWGCDNLKGEKKQTLGDINWWEAPRKPIGDRGSKAGRKDNSMEFGVRKPLT